MNLAVFLSAMNDYHKYFKKYGWRRTDRFCICQHTERQSHCRHRQSTSNDVKEKQCHRGFDAYATMKRSRKENLRIFYKKIAQRSNVKNIFSVIKRRFDSFVLAIKKPNRAIKPIIMTTFHSMTLWQQEMTLSSPSQPRDVSSEFFNLII